MAEPHQTCQAVTAQGTRCSNPPMPGSDYCWVHRDLAEPAGAADDGWLAVVDRAPAVAKAAPVEAQDPADQAPANAPEAEPPGDQLSLPIDDRLTRSQRRSSAGDDLGEAERRGRLHEELTRFGRAAQRLAGPGADAAAPSTADVQRLMKAMLGPLAPRLDARLAPYLTPDLLKGMWYVGAYLMRSQASGIRRRLEGDYEIDDYGRDEAFLSVVMPLAQFLYRNYWRVEVAGIENVPEQGRAMLVSNHSGVLPFDGAMIGLAIYNETASQRLARALVASWFPSLPFVSILLQKTGQVQASPHNAQELLERDELVIVFPEGIKGVGKPYRDRYQLARFGRGGFIRVAVRTGAPIIPVCVVGAEEIYPMIGQIEPLARLLGVPFFPITPTFPWTGPFGLVPLPTKWYIDIGKPIYLESQGARAAANPALLARLTEQVRGTVQEMLLDRLSQRRSVFLG